VTYVPINRPQAPRPKSLLEEIQENAQHVARCPACIQQPGLGDRMDNQMGPGKNGRHARGRYKGHFRSSMPVCEFCKGSGVVFLNRICECGGPAVILDTKSRIWNCGSAICLSHALWRKGLSSSSASTPAGASSYNNNQGDWLEYGG
jgi:hypothetical protein